MLLRSSLARCVRYNIAACRYINVSAAQKSKITPKPNREIYDAITNKEYLDELLSQSGRAPITVSVDEPAIVKKFFVNQVDGQQLSFPEIISKTDLDQLRQRNKTVEEYFKNNVQFDDKGISDSTHEEFKKLNLYGYTVDKEFGGLGYNYTERTLASEAEGWNTGAAMALNAHRLACEAINEFGSEQQRANYLTKLAKGDLVATYALFEEDKYERLGLKSRAEYLEDSGEWCLNGTKTFVLNSAKSNLFLVLAQTRTSDRLGDLNDSMTVFLVDSSSPGVSVHRKDETIGHRTVYQSTVSFDDVRLTEDHVLSIPGAGHHVAKRVMLNSRLQQSVLNLIQLKTIFNYFNDYIDQVEHQTMLKSADNPFALEADSVRLALSQTAAAIYSIESILYMTSGIMDLYENTDVDVETAIVKVHSQELLMSIVLKLLSFLDTRVNITRHPMNQVIRDALQTQTFSEPNDTLRLFVGISGIQYAGQHIFEEVKKKRNPFLNPHFVMKNLFKSESITNIHYTLLLREHLVNVFDLPANWLEASIKRIKMSTETLMVAYGRELPQEHNEIQRVGDAAILTYASFASLARANRSWCLKLPDTQHERVTASCVVDTNSKKVLALTQHIEDGPQKTFETFYQRVAKLLIKNKSYFFVHPLTRFF